MAAYVVLVNWTAQGRKNAPDSVFQPPRVWDQAAALGGIIESVYRCLGRYDFVVIADFPDNLAAAQFSKAISREGYVITETLPAFSTDETGSLFP